MSNDFVIAGFMGVGKTTIGRRFSTEHNLSFIDLDEHIEHFEQKSISLIFDLFGENVFRKLERRHLLNCIQLAPDIISLGGGTLYYNSDVFINQKTYKVVELHCQFSTVKDRILNSSRPLNNASLKQVFDNRARFEFNYDLRIATDFLSEKEICHDLYQWWSK